MRLDEQIKALGFRLDERAERRATGHETKRWWVLFDDGRYREAQPEEVRLWQLLLEACPPNPHPNTSNPVAAARADERVQRQQQLDEHVARTQANAMPAMVEAPKRGKR